MGNPCNHHLRYTGRGSRKPIILIAPTILILYFLHMFGISVYADKPVTLPEILKPVDIAVDDEQLYVAEKVTVYIYSLKDYKLIKKFGRRGRGPGEFIRIMSLVPQDDSLLVTSVGHIYFFSKDGTYKKMLRASAFSLYFSPIGDKFVSIGIHNEKDTTYDVIRLFDSSLKVEKELSRMKSRVQARGNGGIGLIPVSEGCVVCDNKIYIRKVNGLIHCFDAEGKQINTIDPKIQRVKVTDEDKKRYLNYYKNHKKMSFVYHMHKDRIEFPEYFPAIKSLCGTDKNLYVITYNKKNEKLECLALDPDGKLLKKTMLPIRFSDILSTYPFIIKNGKLYQLVENEDEETWELHVTTINPTS